MPAVAGGYADLDADTKARVAFMRFGFGPRPGGRESLGRDADAAYNACLAELNDRQAAVIEDSRVRVVYGAGWPDFDGSLKACYDIGTARGAGERPRMAWSREAAERYAQFMRPKVGFVERLVQFWQNHFSIWTSKASCWVGHLDRYAIRQNVLGNFSDMLMAVEKHPAMLLYLDNHISVGPNSPYAVRWKASCLPKYGRDYVNKNCPTYNENLAREILELHTLGAEGGYTQADVTALAHILTGRVAGGPTVTYDADKHQPGAFTIMGTTYGQADGVRQCTAVLRNLALHPSTATHIATKLIHHFITDEPSDADVETLANVFKDTRGDLFQVSKALLELPSAWTAPFNRIKQPLPWAVSVLRGIGTTEEEARSSAWRYDKFLAQMEWAFWGRVTPDGYPDDNSFWLTGDALCVRRNMAAKLVETRVYATRTMPDKVKHPVTNVVYSMDSLAADLLGTYKTAALVEALKKNWDVRASLPLIFLSPEYIRS